MSAPSTPRPRRALLAEDNPDHAFLIGRILKGLGLEPVVSETAAALVSALTHWTGEAPVMVLLDHTLPDLSGLALLERVRAHLPFPGVPVAMFSSSALPPGVEAALWSGPARPEPSGELSQVLAALARSWTVAGHPDPS